MDAFPSIFRRVHFREFECPVVDHFGEGGEIGLGEALVLGAVEDFAVLDRALGGQFENVVGRVGADEHFQPAEARRAAAAALDPHVVAADGRPPAALADDRLQLEAGELVGHLGQATLDALAQFEAVLRVQELQLFFVELAIAFGPRLFVARPLAPLDRLLQPLLKIHREQRGEGGRGNGEKENSTRRRGDHGDEGIMQCDEYDDFSDGVSML